MNLPHPNPTTREQARDNAIMAAEDAHLASGGPQMKYLSNVSLAWSAIAETFSIGDVPVVDDDMQWVHKNFVHEAEDAIAFKNRMRCDPGYTLMALTDKEYRTIMAMRTGHPETPQKPTVARVPALESGRPVAVESSFYAVLMAVVVATISDQAEGGQLIVHPEDIEATRGKTVTMTPGEDHTWLLRLADSES